MTFKINIPRKDNAINILIAEFMNKEDNQNQMGEYVTPTYDSWDTLVPVAQYIIGDLQKDCTKFDLWIEVEPLLMDNIIDGFREDISYMRKVIIDFITWYNKEGING